MEDGQLGVPEIGSSIHLMLEEQPYRQPGEQVARRRPCRSNGVTSMRPSDGSHPRHACGDAAADAETGGDRSWLDPLGREVVNQWRVGEQGFGGRLPVDGR